MKLCKDCKWSERSGEFMECAAPQNMELEEPSVTPMQVTGEIIVRERVARKRWVYCSVQRNGGVINDIINLLLGVNACGSWGRWFEPKESA